MTRQQFEHVIRALNAAGESGWEYETSPQGRSYTVYAFGAVYRSYPLLLRVIQSHQQGLASPPHSALLTHIAGRRGGPPDPGLEG